MRARVMPRVATVLSPSKNYLSIYKSISEIHLKLIYSTRTSRQPSTPKQVIPFKPPVGFKPASITRSPPPILTNILSSSSIRGKQLWHITIPASVPTNSIKDVSTQSLTTGAPILSHEGSDYGLISEPLGETFKSALLLPSQGSNQYEFTNLEVSKTLHLQQLIRIPIIANERSTLTNGDAKKYIKPVRQQPEGLRMRYRPFGDYSESSGESSSEVFPKKQPQTAHFRVPLGIETELEIERKKIDDNVSHAVRKKEKHRAKSKESARPEAKHSASLMDGKTYPSNKRPEISSLSFEEKTSEKSPRRLSQLNQSSAPLSVKTRRKITSEQSPQRLSQLTQSSAPQSIKTRQKIISEQSPERLSQLTQSSAPLSVKTPQKIKKRKHIDISPSVQTNTLSPIKSHKDPYADSESAPNARSDTKQIYTDSSQPKKKRKKNKLLSDV